MVGSRRCLTTGIHRRRAVPRPWLDRVRRSVRAPWDRPPSAGDGGISAVNHDRRDDPGVFRGGRGGAGLTPTAMGFRGRSCGGFRQRGAVRICASAADFSTELSRQLHLWTADQRHMVSWLTAVAEIGTGLLLGYVGLRARRCEPGADLTARVATRPFNRLTGRTGNQPPCGTR
jgi:hypothetical protein